MKKLLLLLIVSSSLVGCGQVVSDQVLDQAAAVGLISSRSTPTPPVNYVTSNGVLFTTPSRHYACTMGITYVNISGSPMGWMKGSDSNGELIPCHIAKYTLG